jgi:hypothetical protein
VACGLATCQRATGLVAWRAPAQSRGSCRSWGRPKTAGSSSPALMRLVNDSTGRAAAAAVGTILPRRRGGTTSCGVVRSLHRGPRSRFNALPSCTLVALFVVTGEVVHRWVVWPSRGSFPAPADAAARSERRTQKLPISDLPPNNGLQQTWRSLRSHHAAET